MHLLFADETMLENYRAFAKKKKNSSLLSLGYQIFNHPSEGQQIGELFFVIVGAGLETYAIYKYIK